MSAATVKNVVTYLMVFIIPPVADAVYQTIQAQYVAGKAIDWQNVGVVALMALLAAIVAANRPRVGAEHLAAQVDNLKDRGVRRRDMVVLSEAEAVEGLAHTQDIGRLP